MNEFIQTNEIKVIEAMLDRIDTDTLVIFDVDDVLIMPKDQILQSFHQGYINKLDTFLLMSEQESEDLLSIMFAQRLSVPVNPKMINIIATLQSKDIKVMAFTSSVIGKFGYITSMRDWRYDELIYHGYDFKKSWKGFQDSTLNGVKKLSKHLNSEFSLHTTFFKGILFTEIDKGEALELFLNHYDLTFKKIIFIDDRKKYLESVSKTVSKRHIHFVGIEYTAAEIQSQPLNQKRARLQFKTLLEKKKWISDAEADALLVETNY